MKTSKAGGSSLHQTDTSGMELKTFNTGPAARNFAEGPTRTFLNSGTGPFLTNLPPNLQSGLEVKVPSFIAPLKVSSIRSGDIAQRVLEDMALTVRGIKAEPILFNRVAAYMHLQGKDWSRLMDPRTTLEWSLQSSGVPPDLRKDILSDRQNLPTSFDMTHRVPLMARVVQSGDIDKLVKRFKKVTRSGQNDADGLTQLANEVKLPNGSLSKGKSYQLLEEGPKEKVWMLTVRGDHRWSEVAERSGGSVPDVRYGVAITGEALKELFNKHLKN